MKIPVLTTKRSGATALIHTFCNHNRCCHHQAILTQSQMNLGHSDGDNLGNFCASHEQPTRMQIGVVNGSRPLFDNQKKKLRTWKSVRHSTKPHDNDNKCNNTYTGIITFTVGLALLPWVSATHLHWKGSICGKQTEITFTRTKSVPLYFRVPF